LPTKKTEEGDDSSRSCPNHGNRAAYQLKAKVPQRIASELADGIAEENTTDPHQYER
jgi:hypothetical protein